MKHKSYEYSHEGVYQSVLTQALGLKVPEGWAKQIAEQVARATDAWICDKEIVTEADLQRIVCKQLDKLSPDIAYAYRNNDKII